eukprot:3464890-Alexandrium_andersonii.AAC.1
MARTSPPTQSPPRSPWCCGSPARTPPPSPSGWCHSPRCRRSNCPRRAGAARPACSPGPARTSPWA